MSGPLSDLFDGLSDGLILLGDDGSVRYANRAARERFGAVHQGQVCASIRDTLLRWRERGYVSDASSVSLPLPRAVQGEERMCVSLFDGLLDGELAVLIRGASDADRAEGTAQLLLETMGDELRGVLRGAAASLSLAARGVRALEKLGPDAAELLARHCGRSADRVERALGDTARRLRSGRDALAGPVALGPVLADAIDSAGGALARRDVKVAGGAGAESDTVVLGSGMVLRWAFSTLLRAAADAAAPGSVLHLSARSDPGVVQVRLVGSPPEGSLSTARNPSTAARNLAERLLAEAGGTIVAVSSMRRAAVSYVVSLPTEPDAVSEYLRTLSVVERQTSELAQMVLRRIAARASRI